MNAQLDELLRELEVFGAENDAQNEERSRKMLNLERATAQLVHLLIVSGGYQNVLEVGTSNGYSTLWIADAVRQTGGTLTTLECSAEKHQAADRNLSRADLRSYVTLVTGDATASIETLTGPFDCVFFDADRVSAPRQLEILLPKLAPKVLLMHDNAQSHPDEIADYLAAVSALPDFETQIVPVGKGLSLAYRGKV